MPLFQNAAFDKTVADLRDPVSYTHLDVYKRQPETSKATKGKRGGLRESSGDSR